jgi:hypothetical protein
MVLVWKLPNSQYIFLIGRFYLLRIPRVHAPLVHEICQNGYEEFPSSRQLGIP